MRYGVVFLLAGLFAFMPQVSFAESLHGIARQWALIKYQGTDKQQQLDQLQGLSDEAKRLAVDSPDGADYHVWQGIILSTKASIIGGLGALGTAREARDVLEEALKKDPPTAKGYGLSVLAALYGKVPGWPIGFGSTKKAQALFNEALKLEADNIDVQGLYGEFLLDERRLDEAERVLKQALTLPLRPQLEVADQGRKAEIERALARLEKARAPQRVGPQP